MVFIIGTRLFGKCDEIKGLGHVATRFFHFDFLPLFPLESYFVFDPPSGGGGSNNPAAGCFGSICCCDDSRCCAGRCPRVIKYSGGGLNCKSVMVAYFQALAVLVGLVFSVIGFADFLSLTDPTSYSHPETAVVLFEMLVGIFSFTASYFVGQYARRVSFEQAKEIAQKVGNRNMLVLVHNLYQDTNGAPPRQQQQRGDGYGGVPSNDSMNDDVEARGVPTPTRIVERGQSISAAKANGSPVVLAQAQAIDDATNKEDQEEQDEVVEMKEAKPVSDMLIV